MTIILGENIKVWRHQVYDSQHVSVGKTLCPILARVVNLIEIIHYQVSSVVVVI